MVNNFTNSQTYKNLQAAFNGESIASTKYRIYADKARREGYQQIGNIFDEASWNERQHAEIWLKVMLQSQIPPTRNTIPPTINNLQDAATGEHSERLNLYLNYAETARAEGYNDIANLFEGISIIERHHIFRFNQLAENISNNQVFCKPSSTVWICLICGNLVWNECAPEICPICGYPQAYYQLNCENF